MFYLHISVQEKINQTFLHAPAGSNCFAISGCVNNTPATLYTTVGMHQPITGTHLVSTMMKYISTKTSFLHNL